MPKNCDAVKASLLQPVFVYFFWSAQPYSINSELVTTDGKVGRLGPSTQENSGFKVQKQMDISWMLVYFHSQGANLSTRIR